MNITESEIYINGHNLTLGQVMTVWVALSSLADDISRNGLGEDAEGKNIALGYLRCLREIRHLLSLNNPTEDALNKAMVELSKESKETLLNYAKKLKDAQDYVSTDLY